VNQRRGQTSRTSRLIGYPRVSTEDQGTDPQRDELRAAGCVIMHEEDASGADRSRPVLAQLLRHIRHDETLVVARLDRLARSVSHLVAVIEQLEAKGAHFRSLHDPIDTATPQGMFSLQVLGAVAQLERALIAERTKAGLQAVRRRGRVGGNRMAELAGMPRQSGNCCTERNAFGCWAPLPLCLARVVTGDFPFNMQRFSPPARLSPAWPRLTIQER